MACNNVQSMNRSLKLTVTGASGVGKTTLAQKLAEILDLEFIPELARLLCKELGYERIGELPEQEAFKMQALERQIEYESRHDSFVADRSAIDCWVLWQRWNICSAMTYDTEAIYNKVAAHANTYSHVVYIPPLFAAEEDGFRWTEPDYIKQVDRIIKMTFHDLSIWPRVLAIESDNLEERIEQVKSWINI